VRLNADAARLDSLYEILAPEERERAARFRFEGHRRQFIVCRGVLREVLSPYLGLHPADIAFVCNRHGKPGVSGSDVHFNVSHSGEWALQAVARGCKVGVDIEHVDARFVREQIPERYFSRCEVAQLRALPSDQQTAAFFRCWTRKEAYIKARGLGLALPLDSFDVTIGPDDPPALSRAGDWSVQDLDAPSGYAAAIVAEGPVFSAVSCAVPEATAHLPP
jgi:4'-phosphopantetheinyl transferase